jgi:zinc protease
MRPVFVIGLFAALGAASAQEPQRPPVAPPLAFHFPKTQTTTLANGLRVVTVEDHAVQVVAVRVVLNVDELADPPGKEGLYQVMLNSLREGTTTRTASQLAEASARVGTPVSPTSFTTTPSAFDASLALMGDMLMHPSFDHAGVDRRKAAQAAVFRGLAARATLAPRNLVYTLLNGRQDAVTRSYLATEAGVNALSRDDVIGFYSRYVRPKATTVIVVGDLTHENALAAVRRVFGGWQGTTLAEQAGAPSIPSPTATKVYIIDTGPGSNATISMGLTGPARTDPDAYAAEMLGTILTNRMLTVLREKRAWSYSGNMVMSWRRPPRHGELIGTTSIATAKADSALAEWMAVLREVRASPPSADDLEAARRARVGALWSRVDGPEETAARIAESVRDGLPPNYLEAYAAGMNGVTAADVATAAAKYLDPDHLVIVVGGDRNVIEPAIRAANIAPVEIVERP